MENEEKICQEMAKYREKSYEINNRIEVVMCKEMWLMPLSIGLTRWGRSTTIGIGIFCFEAEIKLNNIIRAGKKRRFKIGKRFEIEWFNLLEIALLPYFCVNVFEKRIEFHLFSLCFSWIYKLDDKKGQAIDKDLMLEMINEKIVSGIN